MVRHMSLQEAAGVIKAAMQCTAYDALMKAAAQRGTPLRNIRGAVDVAALQLCPEITKVVGALATLLVEDT